MLFRQHQTVLVSFYLSCKFVPCELGIAASVMCGCCGNSSFDLFHGFFVGLFGVGFWGFYYYIFKCNQLPDLRERERNCWWAESSEPGLSLNITRLLVKLYDTVLWLPILFVL